MNNMPSSFKKHPTLLIGWDAADWKVINPLIDAGKMPNLRALMEGGTMGNIATLQPVLSPTLWTSIATGKRPYKHGIHGFSEPDPVTGGIRPVTNLSRSTKAIWNILNQEEKSTITVGWWPSNPAEPLSRGVMVSNDYQIAQGYEYDPDKPDSWPMKPGTVYPERLTEQLKQIRFHPAELEGNDLIPFMPGLQGMSQEELDKAAKDPRVQSLMKIIADCTSIHSAATALLANEPWDLMSVYYDAIDHFGHAFMKYHPPQREGIDDWDYRLFNYVNEAGYLYHDMLLGVLVDLARQKHPDVTIILLSDHGFHPDDLRLTDIPNEPAGPAAEHRQFGILVANGPGIKKDARIYGASLIDICPTLLHRFGLPVGEDMDGKVLLDLYEEPAEVTRIPSWDEVEGDHGMHPPDKQISAEDSKAALDQLVALGYIDEPHPDQSKAVEQTVRELEYNLAQAWMDGGIYTEAIAILKRLHEKWPMEHRFGFKLATCYQSLGHTSELRAVISTVIERRLKDAEEAVKEIEALKLDSQEAQKEEQEQIEKLSAQEQKKLSKERCDLFTRARPNLFALRYYEATADFAEKKYEDALEKIAELDTDFGSRRQALSLRGQTLTRLQRWDEAEAAYQEALVIDRETPEPLLGLARVYLHRGQYREAIQEARTSAGLLFFQPRAHYLIGMAHYRLGEFEQAEQAFLLTTRQTPLAAAAWRMLAQIAQFHFRDPSKITFFKEQAREARQRQKDLKELKAPEMSQIKTKGFVSLTYPSFVERESTSTEAIITVVSGLPRSGTSLMMQILEAVGIPAFTDGNRVADDSNTKGYYEHDLVSGLLRPGDRSWLTGAKGHALKVVAPLLASLPKEVKGGEEISYRILFMERDLEEILTSQSAMLKRLGKAEPSGNVSKAYQQQVDHAAKWIDHHEIPTLSLSYLALVHQPARLLGQLATFLGVEDQLEAMQAVIDPNMHRVRKELY